MKRLIAAVGILLAALAICIWSEIYTEKAADELIKLIESCDVSGTDMKTQADSIDEQWSTKGAAVRLFMHHEAVDSAETEIEALVSALRGEPVKSNSDEIAQAKQKAQAAVRCLRDTQRLSPVNLF